MGQKEGTGNQVPPKLIGCAQSTGCCKAKGEKKEDQKTSYIKKKKTAGLLVPVCAIKQHLGCVIFGSSSRGSAATGGWRGMLDVCLA